MTDEVPIVTVKDLMDRLLTFDPSLPVVIKCQDDYYSGPISEIDTGLLFQISNADPDLVAVGDVGEPCWCISDDKIGKPCVRLVTSEH